MNTLDSAQRAHVVDTSGSPHARLRPLPLDAVSLADDFCEPRRRINREVTLPSQYRHLEETGRLDNFRRASGKIGGEYQGIYFNDSDVNERMDLNNAEEQEVLVETWARKEPLFSPRSPGIDLTLRSDLSSCTQDLSASSAVPLSHFPAWVVSPRTGS